MIFAGLIKTSLIDYPGVPACVAFTSGCPYDCCFCHNPQTRDGADLVPEEEVRLFLEKRAGLLAGVVISGGEPTIQADLITFCRYLKTLNYQVKLDTNGCHPDVVSELLAKNLLDYIAIDYKCPASRYLEICGPAADSGVVHETIKRTASSSIPWELRTTLIPQLSGTDLQTMEAEIQQQIGKPPPLWRKNIFRTPPAR